MKIKIISRTENHLAPEGCEETLYDVYAGFTGLPTTWPFCTKWVLYMAGLTKEELLKRLEKIALRNQKIIIKL